MKRSDIRATRSTIFVGCGSARAANSVCSLPRLRGRAGEGVSLYKGAFLRAPSLSLPRKRGRESTEYAALACCWQRKLI
jgi:hypothetical protein